MDKILIMEDEMDTANFVKQGLALKNIDSDVAENGEIGLEMFKKNSYDLILLDLQMPKMTGEEVLKEIRRINPYIDIIVYTNYEKYADIKRLVNLGINGYINKGPSADLKELIAAIEDKLKPMNEDDLKKLVEDTEEIKNL